MKNFLLLILLCIASNTGFSLEVNGQLKGALLEKQASDPTGTEARIYYNTSDKKAKIYDGSSWTSVGSGSGGGGINYITNPDFETNATGYTAYDDGASAIPVDGTGGSPSSSFARNTTTPIRATADGKFTIAINSLGEGVAVDFQVEAIDVSKTLSIGFEYKTDADYVDNDLGVYVISTTGGVVKIGDIKKSTSGSKFIGYYSVRADETQKLVIHAQANNAAATDLYVDSVTISPDPFDMVQVVETGSILYTTGIATSGILDFTTAVKADSKIATYDSGTKKFTVVKAGIWTISGTDESAVGVGSTVEVIASISGTVTTLGQDTVTDGYRKISTSGVVYLNVGDSFWLLGTASRGTGGTRIISASVTSTSEQVIQSYEAGTEWTTLTHTQVNALTGNQGFGTFSAGFLQYKRDGGGSDLLYKGKLTAGTTTGVEARLALPSGLLSKTTSDIPSIQLAGSADTTGTGTTGINVLIEPSIGYITFGNHSAGLSGLTKALANTVVSTGGEITINARVPILGWSSQPKLLSLPVSKENVFSAKITSAGAKTSSSSDWITSVTKDSTGTYTINYTKLGLTTAPAVSVSMVTDGISNGSMVIQSLSTTSVQVVTRNTSDSLADHPFEIILQKQGADYTHAGVFVGTVAGDLVSSPNSIGVNMGAVNFHGATSATNCPASSSCTITQNGNFFSSVTQAAAGNMTLNTTKTYSKLMCVGSFQVVGATGAFTHERLECVNCNSFAFGTYRRDTGALASAVGNLICWGY